MLLLLYLLPDDCCCYCSRWLVSVPGAANILYWPAVPHHFSSPLESPVPNTRTVRIIFGFPLMIGRTSRDDALLLSCDVTAADLDLDLAAVAFGSAFIPTCALFLRLSGFVVRHLLSPLHWCGRRRPGASWTWCQLGRLLGASSVDVPGDVIWGLKR